MASYERYREYATASAADLAANNPVLEAGQLAVESDTGLMKVGDGSTAYTSLPHGPTSFSAVWNAAGTTFTGIKLDVTDTASAAGSLLMDLQVGGVSRSFINKTGVGSFGSDSGNRVRIGFNSSPPAGDSGMGLWATGAGRLFLRGYTNIYLGALGTIGITDGGAFGFSGTAQGTIDLALFRDAADTLAQRRGTNAQTFRVYGTYTDASNYRRVVATMSTGGVAEIKPEGAGTGASGNVLHISGLPTANPGPGILWNNGGTVEVGT